MKQRSFILALLALVWLGACRQQEAQPTATTEFPDVPVTVVQALRVAYPTATNLSFTEIDKGNVWESDFSVQAVNHEVKINANGSILEAYALGGDGATGPASVTLPAAAKAYIDKAYPGYKITAIGDGQYNNQKAYKVLLRSEKEEVTLIFDGNGALILELKSTSTPAPEAPKTFPITKADDLPAAARQYLTDSSLVFAKGIATVDKDAKKTYLVYATKGTTTYELVFDADGKLIRSSSSAPRPATPTTVELKSISELPAAAIAYLAGYTFEKGSVTTSAEGKKTYSVAVNKDGKRYEIVFDGDGKILTNKYTPRPEEKALTAGDLPTAITEYLNKTYTSWTFVKGVLVQTDGKPTSYTVVIKVGDILYSVFFSGEGKFEAVKRA